MANPYQFWNHQMAKEYRTFVPPQTPRQISATSSTSSRTHSVASSDKFSGVTTRSDGCPFSPGIVFERSPATSPRSDDDLIFVVVKISNRAALETTDELPSRPAKRHFLRRLGTRILGPNDADDFKAVRMPRSEYKRHFARDGLRQYVGTEPEQQWTEEDLKLEFGQYECTPLRAMHC
ncbi:hypothetical protein LTR27_008496 [Elasticomyces elasticus]|nr:hypothetical protein LTR27_008496 [Elasticomyces elasticus]